MTIKYGANVQIIFDICKSLIKNFQKFFIFYFFNLILLGGVMVTPTSPSPSLSPWGYTPWHKLYY